jgi:hypothetical protein
MVFAIAAAFSTQWARRNSSIGVIVSRLVSVKLTTGRSPWPPPAYFLLAS